MPLVEPPEHTPQPPATTDPEPTPTTYIDRILAVLDQIDPIPAEVADDKR